MNLPDPYPVQPWSRPCRGSIRPPGSKSLSNRALVLAALGTGMIRIEEALFSRDTQILCDCLGKLGFAIQPDESERQIEIQGRGGSIPNTTASLHVGNAGTAARFLTALVCLHPSGVYHFDGDEEMRHRPMKGLIEALERLGARFSFSGQIGHFPFTVETHGLKGGAWEVDASASSQMLSALMMIAPFCEEEVRINPEGARPAFVEMTARLMGQFGLTINGDPAKGYSIPGKQSFSLESGSFAIEPDVSAASYFMALPYVTGGKVKILGLQHDMLQGDLAFADVLTQLGLEIQKESDGWIFSANSPPPDKPVEFSFQTFSDTFLTLAAIAPLFPEPIGIEGIGHTRFQETDRIAAMAKGLRALGVAVEEKEDSLTVHSFESPDAGATDPVLIETFKDHRVAMSFAVLGCSSARGGGQSWIHIQDPACCRKTYPAFFSELENLYRNSHDK